MFTKLNKLSKIIDPFSNATKMFTRQRFIGFSLEGIQNRGISTYAVDRFNEEWDKLEKQEIAKAITLNTIVSTPHFKRQEVALQPPFPPGKKQHPSIKYGLAETYGHLCQVDKIKDQVVCVEHLLLMRTAVAVTRKPHPKIYEAAITIGSILGKELSKLDKQTLASLFEIGSSIKESRSQDVLEDQRRLISILQDPEKAPPQQLLRVLEVVLSPFGMLANTYGGKFCKIQKAKQEGKDVSGLESFMGEMMLSLKPFHVPYIKSSGAPYAHLQMQQYRLGAQISEGELVTVNHYLECCTQKEGLIPEIPQLRSVVVKDPTGRTLHLHDHLNLPHFFDVSGTTGAVMQAALGLLHRAGRSDLVESPKAIMLLGMVLAGCNFYKQGYHNYYEVYPALQWVIHHVGEEKFKELAPIQLLQAVPEVLKGCVDPSSEMSPIVSEVMDLVTEHFELHYELYKQHLREKAQQEQESTPTTPSNTI
ncbi:hypothetical protein EP47_01400 [Legionella norrlandica]|uniref:Uncharacterized protein n=1 Tax=Legionella norrlandica TaxID=1498499 RepID=A0A0A2SNE0_9GAMM|nr:hypothetical protein [Legionella norrlandica]KGP62262.1 hypothetical protein EP47_01400 [Legionella norrlandica]